MRKLFLIFLAALFLTGCSPMSEAENPTQPAETASQVQPAEESRAEETEAPTEQADAPVLPEEILLEEVGQTVVLYEGTAEGITWASEDPAVAAVENGVLTALERGETTVTVTFNGESQSSRVVCDLPVPMRLNEEAEERDPVYLPPDVEIVDDSFFADAVFIGDSQGLLFYNCIKYYNQLEGSMHMARNSYSIESASANKMLMTWRGKDLIIEDAIAETGANRVFFMLGINDIAHYSYEQLPLLMDMWADVITRIQTKTPHVQICIQSVPPVWTGGENEKVNNESVREYNRLLEETAKEYGCVFIDIAPYFMDATGGMATCYSGDKFVHTNAAGADTWVKVLKACTDYE